MSYSKAYLNIVKRKLVYRSKGKGRGKRVKVIRVGRKSWLADLLERSA